MLLGCWGQVLWSQTLEGHVMLGDSLPAPFATVYVPATGLGTVTDQDGYYWLDGLPKGQTEVEFSYLGYRTVKRKLLLPEAKKYAYDEHLAEQPIALSDIYVTPNGEDPALYILRKVAERAAVNKKRLLQYEAQFDYIFHAQDADIIPAILPKAANWAIRSLIKAKHRGAIYDFCTSHERVDARLTNTMIFDHGKRRYLNEKLLSASPTMPDKAREQLFDMSHYDPFDLLYGDDTDYCRKAIKKGKCRYQLKGTIEEGDRVIDVLTYTKPAIDNEHTPWVTTLYVVEDEWGILRMDHKNGIVHIRIECRNVGGGIYLPVSQLFDPSFDALRLEQEMENYKKKQAERVEKGEKVSSIERNMLERAEKFAQKRAKLRPCISTGISISYSKVLTK